MSGMDQTLGGSAAGGFSGHAETHALSARRRRGDLSIRMDLLTIKHEFNCRAIALPQPQGAILCIRWSAPAFVCIHFIPYLYVNFGSDSCWIEGEQDKIALRDLISEPFVPDEYFCMVI